MQASQDDLKAFGERRAREEERNAIAFIGERYRRNGHAFEVFGAYLGELRGDARAAAIRDLAKRVGLTVKAELAFLDMCGHPYPRDREPVVAPVGTGWLKGVVAGVVAGAIALLALLFVGCGHSDPYRPAVGTGKATARVITLVHTSVDATRVIRLRLVTINNPSTEDQILDCHSERIRFPAGKAAEVLLLPGDTGCDLHADVEYSPNTEYPSVPIPDVPIGVTVKDVAK